MSRPRVNVTGLIATILLVVVLPPAGYMGAYYAMLEGWSSDVKEGGVFGIDPVYRAEGKFVQSAFWPANYIDRCIRPGYWGDK